MTNRATIDHSALETLLEAVGGDQAFLAELIGDFFAGAPQLLQAMRQALAAGDPAELRRAAHSLKSNSASFGAGVLEQLCRELEARGNDGRLSGAGALLDAIEAEYARVEQALQSTRQVG